MSSSPIAPTAGVEVFGRTVQYKTVVAAVYVVSLFLDILDMTIVNVALVRIGGDLRSDAVEWIVLGYTLSLAVWIPAAGWLGDRIGTKRTFLIALGAFLAGSAACAMATTVGQLIAFRVLQGVGGGMLTPVGMAMLFRAFPPAERAKAAMFVMIPAMVAPALGPIVGGFLVTHAHWRWIFLINLPIGIPAAWFAARHLREHREHTAGPFDLPGFVLSGAGLATLVFALSEGPRAGWTAPTVVLGGLAAIVAITAAVIVERRREHPLLALRLLGNRLFRQCNVVGVLSGASFIGLVFVMPLYLQLIRGQDAFHSGLTTFPQALGVVLSSQIAGRLYARTGPRRLMALGLLASALTITLFIGLDLHTDLWAIRGLMLLRGLCMGFAFVPMQAAAYATIAPQDNGRASSLFASTRQMAASLGVALSATVLVSHMSLHVPPVGAVATERALNGFRWAVVVVVVLALAASLAAWFIPNEEAVRALDPGRSSS